MKFLGFGNGSDGDLVISTSVTDSPIDSSCSGTSGTNSLTATNASFTAGQFVFIHQSRGTGAGVYEVNKIGSYVAGTITTVHPLENTYTDSGASQAQVVVLKQYGNVTISGTLTAKAWDGDKGGIVAFMANGKTLVSGTITASSKGFRGNDGASSSGVGYDGKTGEGDTGAGGNYSTTANGSGGGGGDGDSTTGGEGKTRGAGGGGGGNGTAGENGIYGVSTWGGFGGAATGAADGTNVTFGGAGGQPGFDADSNSLPRGGNGGGLIYIISSDITVTGSIVSSGESTSVGYTGRSGGNGGGAGGTIVLKSKKSTLGTNTVVAVGGAGGTGWDGANGGAGGVGRIRIEGCSISGTTNPTASTQAGGQSYCSSLTFIQ